MFPEDETEVLGLVDVGLVESGHCQGRGERSDGLKLVGLRQSVELSAPQQVSVSDEALADQCVRQLPVLLGGGSRVAAAECVGGRQLFVETVNPPTG